MRGSSFFGVVLAGVTLVAGCYEIPPTLPAGYLNSSPPDAGWPPSAVYASDPLAPRNRWFQRAYSPRSVAGTLERVSASVPLPQLRELTAVDCAELTALLEADAAEVATEETEGRAGHWVTQAVFGSDALQLALVAAQAETDAPDRRLLLERLLQASVCGHSVGESKEPPEIGIPPPLRKGRWLEWPGLLSSEFLPSARDLRWARLLSEETGGSDRWILLRLRVALSEDRSPMLLPLASECWDVAEEEGRATSVVCWRFDRAEWLLGRDPWVPLVLDDAEQEEIEDIAASGVGSSARLAPASFRASGEPDAPEDFLPIHYRPLLEESWRDPQRRLVQEVLSRLFSSRESS